MFYSKKLNLLFIASPKTGTRSVHEFLEKIDPTGSRREILLSKEHLIGASTMPNGVIGHARARDLKRLVGEEQWSNIETFVFARNPREKLVSAYAFNKTRPLISMMSKMKININSIKTVVSILSAKVLPFVVYFLFYRMKTNREYCCDLNGDVIVKYIGRTEKLNIDFQAILDRVGVQVSNGYDLKHINKSNSSRYLMYYRNGWVDYLFRVIYRKELAFYKKLNPNGITEF